MSRLVYQRDELLSEYEYARPQLEAGFLLHGGFDRDGRYVSPRSRVRTAAVRAWQEELAKRGYPLVEIEPRLLHGATYPSFEQHSLLLKNGFDATLWTAITMTAQVEGRGRHLAGLRAPGLEERILNPLVSTATGHLEKGLLEAHAYDEAGVGGDGPGGHDTMWFAIRELLFGKRSSEQAPAPPVVIRTEEARRMPCLSKPQEDFLLLVMNVLLLEVRAGAFFDLVERLCRRPDLFAGRRRAAELAATLVERIRQDEDLHVAYLRTVVSELRSFTFRLADGTLTEGSTFLDPAWYGLLEWHAGARLRADREHVRRQIGERLGATAAGRRVLEEFDELESERAA